MKQLLRRLQSLTLFEIVKISAISLLIIGLILYAQVQLRALTEGPEISLTNPTAEALQYGIITKENIFTVSGVAKNVIELTINQRPVDLNTDGEFKSIILLSRGQNHINIKAYDRFNKTKEISFPAWLDTPKREIITDSTYTTDQDPQELADQIESAL